MTIIDLATKAYNKALQEKLINSTALLLIVDFTKPSSEKRLSVISNPGSENDLLLSTWVTHGSGSGELYAKTFSNTPDSHQSSLGVFRTGETYIGKHGLSCKLDGLEVGFNNRARKRAIVIHGATYIGDGLTGRSWGCFAVKQDLIKTFVTLVKNGSLLVAYYPDQAWLTKSKFLNN